MERLNVMRSLCEVLEVNFWEKMEELDIDPQVEAMGAEALKRVNMTIELLENTKRSRFLKIKEFGLRLIELKSVMMDLEVDFADVLCFTDAASENEIIQEKALSSRILNKVKCEVSKLEELRGNRLREKNVKIKTKIRELLKCIHLTEKDIEIDLEEEVFDKLKVQKEKLKMEVQKRSDIIIRAEVWSKARYQLEILQNRCKNTKKIESNRSELLEKRIQGITTILLEKVDAWQEKYDSLFMYDGFQLHALLRNKDAQAPSSEGQVPAEDLRPLLPPHPKLPRTPRVPVPPGEHVPQQLHVLAPLLLVPPAGAPPPMSQAVQEPPALLPPLPDVPPLQAGSSPSMTQPVRQEPRRSLRISTMMKGCPSDKVTASSNISSDKDSSDDSDYHS